MSKLRALVASSNDSDSGRFSLGRYHLLELIGRGGRGAVYRAYDPHLKRDVAVKVVSFLDGDAGSRDKEAKRLLQEGEALAKVSNRHIVTVFDVGALHGNVFLVMELVRGIALDDWLKAPRTPAEILAAFVAAGRGLHAAHQAGVIHRDFKPNNVMMTEAGVVKVLDFGLARADQRPPSTSEVGLGTPCYMAPEQAALLSATASSDQFSFCVSLYEALTGTLPPRSATFPASARVSARAKKAIVRGLSLRPQDRYPSMRALLSDLEPATHPARLGVALGGFALFAAATAFLLLFRPSQNPCERGAENFSGIWDDAQARALPAAFKNVAVAGKTDLLVRTAAALDSYKARWVDEHRSICRATHVDRTQPPEILDRKMHCLARELAGVRASVRTLTSAPTRDTLHRAVRDVGGLRDPSLCRDEARGAAAQNPQGQEAQALTLQGEAEARDAQWATAEATLFRAASLATAAGRDDLLPDIWIKLVAVLDSGSKPREAVALSRVAEPLVSQTPGDRRFELDINTANAMREIGEVAGARARFEAVLAKLPSEPPTLLCARAHNGYGWTLKEEGLYDAAIAEHQRALDIYRRILGVDHPDLAVPMTAIGNLYRTQTRYGEARAMLEQVVALAEKVVGPAHPRTGVAITNLANLKLATKDYDGAIAEKRRALAVFERAYQGDHSHIASMNYDIGLITLEQGRGKEALPYLERSAEMIRRMQGTASLDLSTTLSILAVAYAQVGQSDRALRVADEALALGHPEPRRRAYLHYRRARVLVINGRPGDAKEDARHALELFPAEHKAERAELEALLR